MQWALVENLPEAGAMDGLQQRRKGRWREKGLAVWKVGETEEEEQSVDMNNSTRSRSDSSAIPQVTGYNVSAWVDERMLRVVSRVVCS